MKEIRFIASGSNTSLGGFSYGDIARCSDELADHLVKEAMVAEYVQPKIIEEEPQKKVRRSK